MGEDIREDSEAREGLEHEEVEEKEGEERTLSDRELLREQIAERRVSETRDQFAGGESDDAGETREKEKPSDGERAKAAAEKEEEPKFRVKVDGVEKEVPLSELTAGYQMTSTARKRLDEAAQRLKEADDKEAEIAERERQLARRPSDDDHKEGEDDPDEDALFDEALEALLEGDSTKFKQMLKGKGRSGDGATQVTGNDIKQMVREEITQEEIDREHSNAQVKFKSDYADVFGDPDLLAAANKRYYAKLGEGKSITDAMLEAGRETREWVREKAGVKESSGRQQREQRKSSLRSLPVSTGRSGASVGDDDKPETRSEVIAGMQRSRRQEA